MADKTKLTASQEDYVEAIANISGRHRVARVKDIAATLGVAKASVTGALRALSARGLVEHSPYGFVTLTAAGQAAADGVVRRHNAVARFLEGILGINASSAQASACRLEHAVGPDVLSRLSELTEFIERSPAAGSRFTAAFMRFVGAGARRNSREENRKPRGRRYAARHRKA
jgi:DtxR family Mn-dependent transcriptional regulator